MTPGTLSAVLASLIERGGEGSGTEWSTGLVPMRTGFITSCWLFLQFLDVYLEYTHLASDRTSTVVCEGQSRTYFVTVPELPLYQR